MEWVVSLPDRLDSFLAREGRMLSRAKAQSAIEEGHVSVNEEVIERPAHRLQEGDRVEVADEAFSAKASTMEPIDLHLEVLYEDKSCFVINKPAGLAVHPGAGMGEGEQTILHGIAYLFTKERLAFSSESVLVHRLDKETTGCLLIAKDPAAHAALQKQFEARTVKKTYLALVAGIPEHTSATIDSPIGRSGTNRTKMAITGASALREAQTAYRRIGAADHVALLECDLHTGRTHQIRVHLSSIGHPVLGDGSYSNALSERLTDDLAIRTLCLHAWRLTFESPADRKNHTVTAPLPLSFSAILKKLSIPPVDA
ncbi:RluA family pseudouridine synthase [Candidatus Peregrinibacteria bacterium]|nr:RluA family pseudouridine synthase [Candidatus Peregrinibacteria bacterium]